MKKLKRVARELCGWLMLAGIASGQAESSPAATLPAVPQSTATAGTIRGVVKAGTVPLPGVAITAINTLTGAKYATTTDIGGSFAMTIPKTGRYVVRAEFAAFAPSTTEVRLTAEAKNQTAAFALELASRAAEPDLAPGTGEGATRLAAALGRGMQSLSTSGAAEGLIDASAGNANTGVTMPTLSGLGNNVGNDSDSVVVSGQAGSVNGLASLSEDQVRQRIEDAMAQARAQGGAAGDQMNAVLGMLGPLMNGGPGGLGGGAGGGRGGRGGGGGFRNLNPTQPHGAIFYQGSYGALNALPFSLSGAPEVRLDNVQHRFGITFTGSPYLPGLTKPSPKQFIFFNVTGSRNINPENFYAIVPTPAERAGDFSQLTQDVNGIDTPIKLYDPATNGQQFSCNGALNVMCPDRISKQAIALLNYYPAPNIAVNGNQHYNYQTITTQGANATQASLRYLRNFGQQPAFGQGHRQQANAPKGLRQNINFAGSYSDNATDIRNVFQPLGGATQSTGYGVTGGYTVGYGRFTNNASLNWNRLHANTYNYFTNSAANPAVASGVLVGTPTVYSNPFYYGVPSLQFSGFTGLSTSTPSNNINQAISFTDFVSWIHKKHNLRVGTDIRRVHNDVIGGTNVLGSFTFSGYATQQPGTQPSTKQVPSGAGFADFLLGLPQQATVQASDHKLYLRENVFDWYAQDDFRVKPSITLNYGLRYEYFGPFFEKYNRLTNLDHNANFTEVALVTPGQTGPISGIKYPRSLVNADHTNYSPRFGLAWRPNFFKDTVIRAGYGMNYNTTQFSRFAQKLSAQPPFAVTQTNIAKEQGCGTLTLADAYNCSSAPVQSNYGISPFYRLGHVQTYNLDIQKTLGLGIVLNVGYTGSKGGDLDIARAPNRTADGLLNMDAQAFNYEDSLGFSRQNNLSINARKRLQKGISLQATYVYGHSIDDASSINGTGGTVAQNDKDLLAEESNSSFDIRQKLTGNWLLELPFGPNRAFLPQRGKLSRALEGFNLAGDFTFATGSYFTPSYLATAAETATGTNNSLRPDRVFSQSISGPKTFGEWFSPKAFAAPAGASGFGTASRYSIEGPGTVAINASLSRTISFADNRSLEVRMTGTNVFNTVQYSGIDTVENSQNFGQVTSTAGQRTLNFLARYRF